MVNRYTTFLETFEPKKLQQRKDRMKQLSLLIVCDEPSINFTIDGKNFTAKNFGTSADRYFDDISHVSIVWHDANLSMEYVYSHDEKEFLELFFEEDAKFSTLKDCEAFFEHLFQYLVYNAYTFAVQVDEIENTKSNRAKRIKEAKEMQIAAVKHCLKKGLINQ